MKIGKISIKGIKSHLNTEFTVENYNTFVGENNCGKSNIFFAIRWFFKYDNTKMQKEDLTHGYKEDPYVIIEFIFDENEDIPSFLDEDYEIEDRTYHIKAYCNVDDLKTKPQFSKHQLINEDLEPKSLATAKVIKLVYLIFVPSIRELNDELKFTTNSAINKLVSKYVIERIQREDQKTKRYTKVKESVEELSDFISKGDNSAFEQLKASLKKYMLDYGDIEMNFKLNPPNINDLIKNSFEASVKVNSRELPLESQGMGFQRSLIFSLISNMADINPDSSNYLTMYLIEEPELFLHPNHQNYFRDKIIDISRQDNNQVLLTSHSPYFLSNIDNYSQVKRISIENDISALKEIKHSKVQDICKQNGHLMARAFNHDGRMSTTKIDNLAKEIAEEDELRYLLWVDPNRTNAFLSKKVLLVEGPSDKALFSFLFYNSDGDFYNIPQKSEIMVVDITGKFHFYKFANLLHQLGILVWILHDGDDNKVKNRIDHGKLNQYIIDLKKDDIIIDYLRVDPYLEQSLGINKDNRKPDISIYHKLVNNDNNCRNCSNYNDIINFVYDIIQY